MFPVATWACPEEGNGTPAPHPLQTADSESNQMSLTLHCTLDAAKLYTNTRLVTVFTGRYERVVCCLIKFFAIHLGQISTKVIGGQHEVNWHVASPKKCTTVEDL